MSPNTASSTAILVDVHGWGFRDARLEERVQLNAKNIAAWTDAIEMQDRLL